MLCYLPKRMALFCINIDCPGQAGEPQRHGPDMKVSKVTELEERR